MGGDGVYVLEVSLHHFRRVRHFGIGDEMMRLTVYSTYLLWHSLAHIEAYGPMSTHARDEKMENGIEERDGDVEVARPVQAHVAQDSVV